MSISLDITVSSKDSERVIFDNTMSMDNQINQTCHGVWFCLKYIANTKS